jgi:hypothetical protein
VRLCMRVCVRACEYQCVCMCVRACFCCACLCACVYECVRVHGWLSRNYQHLMCVCTSNGKLNRGRPQIEYVFLDDTYPFWNGHP